MYHFTDFKAANIDVTYYVGEFAAGETDKVKKQVAVVPKDIYGNYSRTNVVGVDIYRIDNRNPDRKQLDDQIEIVNGKYNYNDSTDYGDINEVDPTSKVYMAGTFVELSFDKIAGLPKLADLLG